MHLATPSWASSIAGRPAPRRAADGCFVLGVLPGEGVGPELTDAALGVLDALAGTMPLRVRVRTGGAIGHDAERAGEPALSPGVVAFCDEVFAEGGAILAGPGGGRFVYDLRRRFDLFCKLSPLTPYPELAPHAHLKAEHLAGVDILCVRDNAAGVYQGTWHDESGGPGGRTATHAFRYTEHDVRRIVAVGAVLAAGRRGTMSVVVKDAGLPAISALWREVAHEVAAARGVALEMIEVDHAAYRLVQHPARFDVLVAPNMCGDILIDLGAVLGGSRAVGFSGNFAAEGGAVFQTNHGAAHDLAGSGRANPAGHLLALAMLLREAFGEAAAAARVEDAVRAAWRAGLVTDDLGGAPGARRVGTREFAHAVIGQLTR